MIKLIARQAMDDDIAGESAKAAYYFFLSLFPAIIALFAFTGILGGQQAFDAIMGFLNGAMPGEAANYLGRFVREITGRERPGMLSLGLLLTVWSASNIFATLAQGLNVMYDVDERRSWWRRKAISIAAMVVTLAIFIAGATAVLAGPTIIEFLNLPPIWGVLRWPLAFLLVAAVMWVIYYWLPNHERSPSPKWTVAGALCAAAVWTAATLGFKIYVSQFGSYSKTYGVVGGIIVLLLWLYFTAFSVLVGGEVAATLEQRSTGKEKLPRAARRKPRLSGAVRAERGAPSEEPAHREVAGRGNHSVL